MSGQHLNLNAAKNGKRLRRLTVGELPAQLRAVKREGRAYRRALESAVEARHGEISATHAHAIDTASAATIHAGVCRWLLRERIEKMTTADILSCSRESLRAKQTRDKAIEGLKLEVSPEDELRAFYSTPFQLPALPPAQDDTSDDDGPAKAQPVAHSSPDCDAPGSAGCDETHRDAEGCQQPQDTAGASQRSAGASGDNSTGNEGTRHAV